MEVKIWQDTDINPRKDWDNLGTLALKGVSSCDESINDPIDWLAEKLDMDEDQVARLADKLGASYYSNPVKDELEARFLKKYVALPVFKYEHSGVEFNTTGFHCRWDSGQVGYIYMTKEQARETWGMRRLSAQKRKWTLSILKGEIEIFSLWANGDVYGVTIYDGDAVVDSCGGFFGNDWETNGVLDNLDFEAVGLTNEAFVEKLEDTEVEY